MSVDVSKARIVPDETYLAMWRVQWPSGRRSGMLNRARARQVLADLTGTADDLIFTYRSASESADDRASLQSLLAALDATELALRRDECKAWRINGSRGHIYTWGPGGGYCLYASCRSARHWTATKQRLSFCLVTQDADDDGCFRLDALPSQEQAEAIRRALGIRKRQTYDPVTLERMRERGRELVLARKTG